MNIKKAEQILSVAKQAGAEKVDVVGINSVDLSVSCRHGKQEELERSESTDVGIRVWVGDSQAIVSSSDISDESISELAARAVAMAKAATADIHAKQADTSLLATKTPDFDMVDDVEPSEQELFDTAKTTEDAALAVQGITNSEGADASFGLYKTVLLTSNGFAATKKSSIHSVSVSVIAGEGTTMETDYDYSTARHRSDLASPESIGKNAAERTIKRLNPRKIATCQVPVVFDPRISRGLVATFAGSISGSSIARGTSFLKDKMEQKLFNDNVRIIDNPHIVRGLSSRPFDGEGVATKKLSIVENGVLQSWLLDVRSASKLGLTTTGHAARGLASPPSPSSSNLYMENGDLPVAELISDIKSGFYVTETFGMGINTITGDYSQGASGFWIENGEILYSVSEITIAGNMLDMFSSAIPADDLEFKYSTNAPTLRIEGMTVAGG